MIAGDARLANVPCQLAIELRLLYPEETDIAGEQACFAAIGEDNLDLAFVAAQRLDDPELEQKELHILCELIAVGGVRHLDRLAGQQRRRRHR